MLLCKFEVQPNMSGLAVAGPHLIFIRRKAPSRSNALDHRLPLLYEAGYTIPQLVPLSSLQ